MAELNWKHQTLIQALLSRGPLNEADFHQIFKGLTGKSPATDQQLFDDYLLKINKALSYVQFELRCCRHQYDGQVYYGIVNNVSDEQSKLGTTYSTPQIAFYKAIIEAIVQDATAQGSISNISALNLRLANQVHTGSGSQSQGDFPALRNVSLAQKEKTLNKLLDDQWLINTTDGKIGLGIQSFLDLRSWFRSNDVPSCEACNEAGVKAELCQNENCTARIHQYCLKKFFSQRKGGRVCPRCGTQWQFKGPQADALEEDDTGPITTAESRAPSEPKRKRPRTNEAAVCTSSQVSVPDSRPRRVTRSSAHAR